MKKGIICLALTLSLLCGCGNQATVSEQDSRVDTVEVAASHYETAGDASAQSGKVTAAKVNVGEKKWETRMDVLELSRDGKKIYGELYRPVGDGLFPGVVIAHGFNGTCNFAREAAKEFAQNGVVAYIFDFIGGGDYVSSEGSTMEMSVLTEAADFNIAFDTVRALDYVDENRMFVMGESQGGYVATYIAGTRPDDVIGLIALYPAYNLPSTPLIFYLIFGKIPEQSTFLGCTISRKYYEDLAKVDIYKLMKKFKGKTVIIHGDADELVPISYSEKAVEVMKDAKLVTLPGADHGFGGNSTVRSEALKLMAEQANK